MKEEFVSYEQALALKELGFDEPCLCTYYTDSKLSRNPSNRIDDSPIDEEPYTWQNSKIHKYLTSAPLKQQVFRWFREKHQHLGFIEPSNGYKDKSLFAFYICDDEQNIIDDSHSYSKDGSLHFNTYEETEDACIDKLIELIKNNDNKNN